MNANNNNCKVRELNNNRRQKLKKKSDKNRIIFIGAGSFIAFFLIFIAAASMMSPKIDISNQSQIDESSLTQMSSDDFKGRIDQSLKQIEKEESNGGSYSSSRSTTTAFPDTTKIDPTKPSTVTTTTPTTEITQEQQIVNDSISTEASMPSDEMTKEVAVRKVETRKSIPTTQSQPVPPKPILTRPIAPLILRDRIRPSSSDSQEYGTNQQ